MSWLYRNKLDHEGLVRFFRNIALKNLPLQKSFSYSMGDLKLKPVFLYGPFKKGKENHLVVEALDGVFVSKGVIEGYDLWASESFTGDENLPVLLEGVGKVQGELFLLPHLSAFENYKGCPLFYKAHEVEVVVGENKIMARTYLYKDNDLIHKIVSGEF